MTRTRSTGRRLAARAAAALFAVVAAAPAWSGATRTFNARPVSEVRAPEFSLRDADGEPRSAGDFLGRAVLMFFGFTHCPDVCPTELARLAEVMKVLGPEAAERVQVIFVTLDPQRDTAELLRDYVAAFSPDFIALRGSDADTAAMAKNFQVFYRRIEGSAPGRYTLEHSAYIHAIDPLGRLRLRIPPSLSPRQIAADVRALLDGG